jgi:endonuclease/exonuclease/phosphatase family metal-dependent hydrolase
MATFNLRSCRSFDGRSSWPFRRRAVAATIRGLGADVAGLQEVHRCQERYLLRALGSYRAVGRGRAKRGGDERCPVLHRPVTVAVGWHQTRWYSDAPDRPGTRLPQASFPRIATLVGLTAVAGGQALGVANTHLDEHRPENRAASVDLLLGWLRPGLPWVIMGDLNATPDDPVLERLAAAGFRSALPANAGGTVHGFTGRTDGRRVDHILVDQGWEVVSAGVDTTRPGGRLPSDHWPLVAELRLA